ncbi:MAG: GAF domain-containing protein [Chloroflexi bacterium]|nr:GAF domain-containing protein [Chloroflexota bacterium]
MNKKTVFIQMNETQRYALIGALFGLTFPIIGTLLRLITSDLQITIANLINAQTTDPILWVVDTAPFVLAFFAGYAGRTQDRLLITNDKLVTREQELYKYQLSLEQRVEDRTREIEHRNSLLRAVAEVGKGITSYRNLTELLQQTTYLIHNNFGYYHVGVFLLDDRKEYAVLAAANSEGGQRMLERNHQLKVGETGIVGYVTETVKARIALDVGQDAVFFNNPDLPETRSEMALPLVVGGRVFGALDVQSTEPQAFTEDDIATLQILAEQLAVAIQNANLFSETEKALEASKSIFGNISREAWGKILHTQPRINFLATPPATVQIFNQVSEQSIGKAVETGDIIIGTDGLTISVPIKVRGLIIGAIRLKKNEISEAWTQDETNLAISLSDQLSGALESARLYKESQQLAARESLVSNISSRIGAYSNIDSILRETVQELGQTIGNASVSFQLVDQFDSQKQAEGRGESANPESSKKAKG